MHIIPLEAGSWKLAFGDRRPVRGFVSEDELTIGEESDDKHDRDCHELRDGLADVQSLHENRSHRQVEAEQGDVE